MVGMGFSNLIAIAIIITTAATLHSNGKTDIEYFFAGGGGIQADRWRFRRDDLRLGIIGTGLLAIPVLAGSTAYADRRRHENGQ